MLLSSLSGKAIFDAQTKLYLDSFQEIQTINYEDKGFGSDKPHVGIQKSEYYKETTNTLDQYVVVTDTDCECYYIWNQIFFRPSLFRLLDEDIFQIELE